VKAISLDASGCCLLAYLEGEYGIRNLFVGRARQARRTGHREIFEARLTERNCGTAKSGRLPLKNLWDVMAPKLG